MAGGMNEMLARALLGNGMAGNAADTSKLYPQYQEEMIDAQSQGKPPIPFEQWVQQFMGQQQQMPQGPQGGPLGGMPM